MEHIKKLSDSIRETEGAINAHLADLARCDGAIVAGDTDRMALRQLEEKRRDAMGDAFLTRKRADIADIDRQIKAFHEQSAKRVADAEGARAAREMVAAKIEQRTAELTALQAERDNFLSAELERQFCEGEKEYIAALDAVGVIVARLVALDYARVAFLPRAMQTKNGSELFEQLRRQGLPVSYRISKKQAAHDGKWASPAWLGKAPAELCREAWQDLAGKLEAVSLKLPE